MDSAEEPHNLPKEALKEEDFENEWMEQKVNLKKLPQQYMQLSKIRLTGCITFLSPLVRVICQRKEKRI